MLNEMSSSIFHLFILYILLRFSSFYTGPLTPTLTHTVQIDIFSSPPLYSAAVKQILLILRLRLTFIFFSFSAPLNFYATHEQQSYNISLAAFSQWHKQWPAYCLIFEEVPSFSIQCPYASRNIGLAFHGHLGFIHCNSKSL